MISETLIGVIIGGIIGLAGNALNIFHSKKEREREKKEVTYLKAIDITTRYYSETYLISSDKVHIPTELKIELNSIKSYMTIYGTEEIYDCFIKVITSTLDRKLKEGKKIDRENNDNNYKETFKEFNEMIIEDLNK